MVHKTHHPEKFGSTSASDELIDFEFVILLLRLPSWYQESSRSLLGTVALALRPKETTPLKTGKISVHLVTPARASSLCTPLVGC